MNVFDDLLYEVLHQDGNQQPPLGMKKKILAALPVKATQFSGQRTIWVGVAAAMLIGVFGVATWTLVHTRSGPTIAPASDQRSLMGPADPHTLVEGRRPDLPTSAQKPPGRKLMLHKSIRPQSPSQQRAIRIAPVVIEPLVIKPIEIASMTPSSSTMKGTLR
jgi:hypothetical protein